jgi:isopentenyldiphosphate isomerase
MDPNEPFDVVDENDNVIGQASRGEVHAKGLVHRSVFFFVFNEHGKVFVCQRSLDKEFDRGCWSVSLGGHVGSGESYDKAVKREAKEEAGISGEPVFIKAFKNRLRDKDQENVRLYYFVTDKGLKIDRRELIQGRFVGIDEIQELMGKERFIPETENLFKILKSNPTLPCNKK